MSPSTILLSILFGNAATAAALSTRGEAGEAAYAQTKKVVYKDQHQLFQENIPGILHTIFPLNLQGVHTTSARV